MPTYCCDNRRELRCSSCIPALFQLAPALMLRPAAVSCAVSCAVRCRPMVSCGDGWAAVGCCQATLAAGMSSAKISK